jgi:hypothetical protein
LFCKLLQDIDGLEFHVERVNDVAREKLTDDQKVANMISILVKGRQVYDDSVKGGCTWLNVKNPCNVHDIVKSFKDNRDKFTADYKDLVRVVDIFLTSQVKQGERLNDHKVVIKLNVLAR